MRYIKLLSVALLTGLFMMGCSSTKNISKVSIASLTDKWVLTTINGTDVSEAFPDKTPTIKFDFENNRVFGNSGCNSYTGGFTYDITKGEFQASQIAGTMMACPNASQEPVYTKLLSQPSKLTLVKGQLIFTQGGKQVLVFEKEKPLGKEELAGTWNLQSLQGASTSINFKSSTPTIEFDFTANKVKGNAGCNNYNATFKLVNNVLTIGPAMSTKKACPDLEGETKLLKALTGVINVEIENGLLTFKRDGLTLMRFQK